MIPVVFRANHFVKRYLCAAPVASIALNCVPGPGKRTGVLDADGDLDPFAAIDQLETLHYMKLGRMWRAVIVHVGAVIQPDGVNHQSVAVFVVPDRFAVP